MCSRGLQGDVVYLSLPIAPLVYEPKCGGTGWGCGVSANENSFAHHVTLSQNKLWSLTIYLPMMCREVWKKSGAWFFKGMPKSEEKEDEEMVVVNHRRER
jgi:hypothetical protein